MSHKLMTILLVLITAVGLSFFGHNAQASDCGIQSDIQHQVMNGDFGFFSDLLDQNDIDHSEKTPFGSMSSDNAKTNWTSATCQTACQNAGCTGFEYIGRSSGGSCKCTGCGY